MNSLWQYHQPPSVGVKWQDAVELAVQGGHKQLDEEEAERPVDLCR